MKITLVTNEPFPYGMSAASRISNIVRAVRGCGVDCNVLICRRTEVYGRKSDNTEADGEFSGVPFHYVSGTPLRSKSLLSRKIRDILDIFGTLAYLKKTLQRGDAIIAYLDECPFFMYCLVRFANRNAIKYVAELCEYPFGAGTEDNLRRRSGRKFVLKNVFPRYDGVLAISAELEALCKKYCHRACRIVRLPILVDFDKYYLEDTSTTVERPYILHLGTLYEEKDGVLEMLESFGRAVGKGLDADFVLCGSLDESPVKSEIIATIKRLKISDRIIFKGYVRGAGKEALLSGASAVIIYKKDNRQNRFGFPTKLAEYLAAGKAVITTDFGEIPRWLKDSESAIIVGRGDIEAVSEALIKCVNNPEFRSAIGAAGREVCRKYFDYMANGKLIVDCCKVKRVSFVLPNGCGGSEKITAAIASYLDPLLYQKEFLIVGQESDRVEKLITDYNCTDRIRINSIWNFGTLRISSHLRRSRPDVVFCSLHYLNVRILASRFLISNRFRAVLRSNIAFRYENSVNRVLMRLFYPCADCLVMQTDEMRTEFASVIPGASSRMLTLPNPLRKEQIDRMLDGCETPYDGGVNYVAIGRIVNDKGFDVLLNAFAVLHKKLPEAKLYILGDNSEKTEYLESLLEIIASNDLEHSVVFTGYKDNPYPWLKYSSCFVLPSRVEGLPNVLIEAQYLNVPSVATLCVPSVKTIIEDGKNGIIVPVDNPEALEEAMEKALSLKVEMSYKASRKEDFVQLFD